MIHRLAMMMIFAAALLCGAVGAQSQPPAEFPDPTGRNRREDSGPGNLKEMLAKQRAIQAKKDHKEMLDRGEEALKLATELQESFAANKTFSQQDRERLESLENVVEKIRKELGGDEESMTETEDAAKADDRRPSTTEEAFEFLKSKTVKLVDELKKTTRYSISVVAIHSSNSVLRLVRFLRLKK